MRICIGVTFVTVVVTAAMLWPGTGAVLEGLFVPRIPDVEGEPVVWTVALIGGLGGTLTVLCYGYWLREDGRTSPDDLRACRIDIAASYAVTAMFGVAMMIVGSNVHIEGEGTALLVTLSQRLGQELGPAGKWLFLVGTCGTVFASMLGVWQSAPYLFADCWRLIRDPNAPPTAIDRKALPYRGFLVVLALVPMIGLFFSFREVQKIYTVIGAYVFPLLALTLLVFNGRTSWVGERFRNRPLTVLALAGVLAFFTALAVLNVGG
jgi:Mn2+/Fe2+ NRAMP family transporter